MLLFYTSSIKLPIRNLIYISMPKLIYLFIICCLLIACSKVSPQKTNKTNVITQKVISKEEIIIMSMIDSITENYNTTLKNNLNKYLLTFLSTKESLANNLDSLTSYPRMGVARSADKKIRIISYDLAMGSYHPIYSVVQYITDDNTIKVKMFNESSEEANYLDLSYYDIQETYLEGKKYYLTKGWGSYGGGTDFKCIRAFQIQGDSLIEAKIFEGYDDETQKTVLEDKIVLEIYRNRESRISYDTIRKQFVYLEFDYNYNEDVSNVSTNKDTLRRIYAWNKDRFRIINSK